MGLTCSRPLGAILGPSWGPLGASWNILGPSWGSRWPKMGERWAQDGPRDGSKIELKRGRGVKNRVLTLLNRTKTLLDAIFSASSASFSHLQRSEADLTPHVRSVLALLHPNEPRKALLSPSWGRLEAQDGPQGARDGPKKAQETAPKSS